jgi:ABC-2 type transport system ATP-binding protein
MAGVKKEEIDDRIAEAVFLTGTSDIIEKKFGKMSLGQQHRVEVARAIATANDILLMDEPFIGIDIDTKRRLKVHFKKWVREKPGRAIVFTSHNLMENEGFVDILTFIMKGRTVETGSVDHFKTKYLKPTFVFQLDDIENGILVLQAMKDVKIDKVEDGKVWISLTKEEILKEVNKSLALKDIGVLSFKREGSVEDVFSHISEVVT